jgi:translation initiation factor 4A
MSLPVSWPAYRHRQQRPQLSYNQTQQPQHKTKTTLMHQEDKFTNGLNSVILDTSQSPNGPFVGHDAESDSLATNETPDLDEAIEDFEDMNLPDQLLRGIYAYGFEKPSAIQQRAVRPIRMGRDLIAQAQSGTGKTGAFAIGTLATIDTTLGACQSIILSPTRELAKQTRNVVASLGEYMNVQVYLCVGGGDAPVHEECRKLRRGGYQIIVGSPGRVLDLIRRRALSTDCLRQVFLDEADEMLSRGFSEQVYEIFQYIPESTQVCLFSATIPLNVLEVTERFVRDPIRVLVKKDELTLEGIQQFYIGIGQEDWKLETLCDLYESVTINQAIIYCNRREKVEWLQIELESRDFTVSCMHGDLDQHKRDVMREFRSGSSRVLISTDLLARGIDVQHVSLVINYDIPLNRENYIHRIGRTDRFGRKGVAINFVTNRDICYLRDIEDFYATEIMELPENVGELM